MPKQCPGCGQMYPDFVDFCVADGLKLDRVTHLEPNAEISPDEAVTAEFRSPPINDHPDTLPGRARLFPKVRGVTQSYGVEFFGDVVLGKFDPAVGAVDVDLSDVPDHRFISPRHATLSFDGLRGWVVEDLGSENGVFVNRGPRITEPEPIRSGDELSFGNAIFVFEADELDETEDHSDGL